ncbi:MAG: hypothetical protein IID53_16425 [Proteobacteria bacterium]|nr:hypothetical protein [Pseudomonadota bacterium]MCH8098644.1 hypothetical protein [Pseudomonadota bacterium]
MQALKTLVIVLGVVIVAGIAVIGVTIYHRATNPVNSPVPDSPKPAAKPAAKPAPKPATEPGFGPGFGRVVLELPPGSRVVEMTAEDDRLILRLRLADGGRQILILDMATGKRLGTFELKEGELRDGGPRDGAAARR